MAKNDKNKQSDTSNINGISIIKKDDKLLYSPFFSNKGYIITASNGIHYRNYAFGNITAMIVFMISYFVSSNVWIGILTGIVVAIINISIFYSKFISKASTVEFKNEGKKKKDSFVIAQAKNLEFSRIKELIICYLLLVLIFIFLYYWQNPKGIYLYITIATGLASFIAMIAYIRVWFYKKNNL